MHLGRKRCRARYSSVGPLVFLGLLLGGLVFVLGLRLGLLVRLVFLLLAFLAVRRLIGRRVTLGVVGYVPPRTLELHGGSRNYLLHSAPALRTFLHVRIGELLDFLKSMMALLALVLVKWHGFSVGP